MSFVTCLAQEKKDEPMRSGITAERETELLAKWHESEG